MEYMFYFILILYKVKLQMLHVHKIYRNRNLRSEKLRTKYRVSQEEWT